MTGPGNPRLPIRFRGRSFLAMVLAPVPPIAEWLTELDALKQRAPAFLTVRAIILDVTGLRFDRSDLADLIAQLAARDITILGIEGIGPTSLGPGFPPPLTGGKPADDVAVPEAGPDAAPASAPQATRHATAAARSAAARGRSLVLDAPVRSGQSIQHLEGDVTVMGSVASGAEVIAGGSIHVYGALRGRAIAGAVGNPDARILCRKFEPELIAIDGLYKTADDLDARMRGLAIQARLDGDAMVLAALD